MARAARISIFVFATISLAFAGQQSASVNEPQITANELVRLAVANELKAEPAHPHFMYRDVKRKDDGTIQTKQMIDTSQGIMLGRIIAINGKPLGPQQRAQEDARLQRLVDDPSQLTAKSKQQKEDDQRVRTMVGALPDAFIFEYSGTEQGKTGEIKVLKFRPNPNYNPPTRELQVYGGMDGTMKVAVPQNHIVLLEANLFRQVNFGWGILGHLNPGGQFIIEQSAITPEHWDLTHMKLNFTGKALFFKNINIQEDEWTTDYQEVPPLSVAEAVQKLKQVDSEIAANGLGRSSGAAER
ncbi:MAG TPA: hypothetical protein VKW78_20335 [Terriglobales bacterium]|nr:hypothetical protein [Terriglobales bacterium]